MCLCREEGANLCAKRPVTFDPLPDGLALSVGNLMRRRQIHLLRRANGAQMSPLIYAAKGLHPNWQPRRIRCYNMSPSEMGIV